MGSNAQYKPKHSTGIPTTLPSIENHTPRHRRLGLMSGYRPMEPHR